MDSGSFINEVKHRLGADFPTLAEDSTHAVFAVLHQRLEPGQAGHIASHLPSDLREEWEEGYMESAITGLSGAPKRMDKHQFLEAVKEEAGFRNTDEAFQATTAVFGALKCILPEKDVRDTAAELPEDLRQIWNKAA